VASVLETTNGKDTPVVEALQRAITDTGVPVEYAEAGRVIDMGDGVTFAILSPQGDETNWESNMASIVMKVQYGSTSVMLTGDAPMEIEKYLVETYGSGLRSDVLKLGHHGSKTSSSDEWLDAVAPMYAVVSAGVGNKYGHPHQEVMQRVFKRNIQSSHTGTDGTVTFQSDGKTIWRK
jgi:beta-lactamase superfamily II metal-dependent hydrolase